MRFGIKIPAGCTGRHTRSIVAPLLVLVLLMMYGGRWRCAGEQASLVNLSHLNALYQNIQVDGQDMGIVRIYAEYPDYRPVAAPGEGIACVDDAARAILVYLKDFRKHKRPDSWKKVEQLLKFLLYMQSPRGTFFNFIGADYSINREGRTSKNRPDWWTWRAQWAMASALPELRARNVPLALQVEHALQRSVSAYESFLKAYPREIRYGGLRCPAYLPMETGADQAAVILLALAAYLPHLQEAERKAWETAAIKIGQGLLLMQTGDSSTLPFGAFRSWRNIWHAWGNSQAHALMVMGHLLQQPSWIRRALVEVDHFYPYLLKEKFLHRMDFEQIDNEIRRVRRERFPQIAYDIRPMVMAGLTAYRLTRQEKYARLAGRIAAWLVGYNSAKAVMYDVHTGRCFDGLYVEAPESEGKSVETEVRINRNSGAESTIEALMILQAVEEYPIALAEFHRLWRKGKGEPPSACTRAMD